MKIKQLYQMQLSEEPDNPVAVAPIEGLYMVALEYGPDVFQYPANYMPDRQKPVTVAQSVLYDLEETSSQNL